MIILLNHWAVRSSSIRLVPGASGVVLQPLADSTRVEVVGRGKGCSLRIKLKGTVRLPTSDFILSRGVILSLWQILDCELRLANQSSGAHRSYRCCAPGRVCSAQRVHITGGVCHGPHHAAYGLNLRRSS